SLFLFFSIKPTEKTDKSCFSPKPLFIFRNFSCLKLLAATVLVSLGSMQISAGTPNDDKANNARGGDHISQMPEDILSFILSFLTMRDAVKTRVLSPRWRYLSSSTGNLYFDLCTLFGIGYDWNYLSKNSDSLWEGKDRFINTVDQIMQLYRSPKLYSFKVSYCLGNECASHIDRWISFAVRMQIEKIDLDFSFIPRGCEKYKFPCHLLAQDKGSQLKHLSLESCVLSPSPDFTNRFFSLKTLDLIRVPLDQIAFDSLLSGCINLECMTLEHCSLPASLFIRGNLLCLKSLVFKNCDGPMEIEVSSIYLTTFVYMGWITNLRFVGALSLEKVHLWFLHPDRRGTYYMFGGLAKELPDLQVLSLGFVTTQVLPIPVNMTEFSHLKELKLILILSSDFDLLSVASILNASPCLLKFHLSLRHGSIRGPRVKRDYSKQLYYKLKEVEISGLCGRLDVLELAIYLLNNAIGLERMILEFQKRWRTVDEEEELESKKKQVHGVLSKEKPNVEIIVQ
ncbi:hypothetical protein IFM89_034259, partial [Coptis chinensis]